MSRQRRTQRQGRRCAANGGRTARQNAEGALEAEQPRGRRRHHNCQHHRKHDEKDRVPAKRGNLRERNAQPQQGNTDTQNRPRGEVNAGRAGIVGRQKIHCHAEQQRDQHDRRCIVLGNKGRGGGKHCAGQHAGKQSANARQPFRGRQNRHGGLKRRQPPVAAAAHQAPHENLRSNPAGRRQRLCEGGRRCRRGRRRLGRQHLGALLVGPIAARRDHERRCCKQSERRHEG